MEFIAGGLFVIFGAMAIAGNSKSKLSKTEKADKKAKKRRKMDIKENMPEVEAAL